MNVKRINVQRIGENAGTVWHLLHGENRKWEYSELKKVSGLSDRELNTAIGWLAREGKIYFETNKEADKEYLYLVLNYYIG